MNDLLKFEYEQKEVRIVPDDQGEPWFVAKDVCDVLGIANSPQACQVLDEDEKGICKIDTLGGPQDMLTISESGLYALILRSNKPAARSFRRWVTHEVLPQIRKTGSYSLEAPPRSMLDVARKYEHIARVVHAIKSICRAMGLRGINAVARANELTFEETGFDCMEYVGLQPVEYIPIDQHLEIWIEERCGFGGQNLHAYSKHLHADYELWCLRKDLKPFELYKFVQEVKRLRPELIAWNWKRQGERHRGLRGIYLKPAKGGAQ